MRPKRKNLPGFESPLARAPRFTPAPGESLLSLYQKRRLVQQLDLLAEDAKMEGLHHSAVVLRDAVEKLRIALVADAE